MKQAPICDFPVFTPKKKLDFESWPAMLGLTGGLGGLDLFCWIHQLQLCRKTIHSPVPTRAIRAMGVWSQCLWGHLRPSFHVSVWKDLLSFGMLLKKSVLKNILKNFSAASRLWRKSPHLRGDLCHRIFCKPSTTTQEKPNVGLIPHRQFTKNRPLRVVIYPSSTKHQSVSNFLLPRRSELRVLFQNTKVML